jgi:hypothetical protein
MPSKKSKKQARITFTPLPSSAEAVQGYNKQIQERAAAVGYGGGTRSSKRQKMQSSAANTNTDTDDAAMLPTPAEEIAVEANEDEDELPRSSQKASRKRAKQQRLDFGPSSGTVNLDPPTAPSMFTKHRGRKRAAESESDESDDLPSPGKIAKRAKAKMKSSNKKQKSGFMSPGGKKVTRSSQKQREATPEQVPEEMDVDEEEEEDIVVPSARKSRRQTQKAPTPEESDDEVIVASSRRSQRQPQVQTVSEDEDSDDMPTTMGTQKRRRKERQSSFISSSPPAETAGSEDDLQIIEDPRGKRAKPQDDESDEDDVVAATPGRRRLKRGGRQMTQQEQEDLDEDLDFIGPSSDVEHAPRDSQTIKKNARQQALERLKQVRSSQSQRTVLPEIQEDDEDDEEPQPTAEDELDELYDNSDESPEPAPTSSRAMFAPDEDDEDFIEEGDDDTLGVPDGIPLAFTRYASMKAKDLWKFAIEWMVQKKINPAFAMDDEIYTLTFQKLDDEVSGLVGSKFASSAWRPDFTIALRSRPEIAYTTIDRHSAEHAYRDKCDACNRSGHPATSEVQFQGKPYNRHTLDEVGKADDDDDDEDNDDEDDNSDSDNDFSSGDRPDYDAQGREVPPANKTWYVGKFCMSNARTAHALQHWRYHLYEWVVIWIDGKKYSTPKELKKRDKMSTKKRRKYANKIVDRMADEGVLKQLWKEFRGTIDDAANAKQGRYEVASP